MTADTQISSPIKAYSYLRCSTPEQMQGDSFRRQIALADAYCLKRGWELDRTLILHDIGMSAFRGRNAVEGNLGRFFEHVQTGEVASGSILLIESLDRFSRQEIGVAQLAFLNLLRSGISIVTLLDEQEYSWASVNSGDGMMRLISSLTIMARAHEESATKARRLKAAWAAKRDRLADGKAFTSKVPAWMRLNPNSGGIELIPERAAIVERVFRETLEGQGQHHIAASLNREGVKPWGRAKFWQRSYIAKILTNEAVIGTFVPHTLDYVDGKKTRTPQEPVRGYFPAAVSKELWADVRAISDGKPRARGRHAARPVSHMLARLAKCPECGGTMTRVAKGKRSHPALVCAAAKSRAGCAYKTVRVDMLEDAIVERLPVRLRDAPAGNRDTELDTMVLSAGEAFSDVSDRIARILEAIEAGGDSLTLASRLRVLEGEYEEARDTLRRLEARRAETAGQTVQARIARLLGTLEPEEGDPLDVVAINAAMLAVFEQVVVDYRHGVLDFVWQHGGSVELPFALPSDGAV
ncbi:recombinase family protein [Altererythrobacter fulvus]|uniref:recombinase family protein n=1 Tax=Caenibius fulvus TaxID=2126012 RepID=UPI003018D554